MAPRLGAFMVGGFASTLLHRHDIRVGIASGMFLKPVVPETAVRLELLMVLYPCYWKWSSFNQCGMRFWKSIIWSWLLNVVVTSSRWGAFMLSMR